MKQWHKQFYRDITLKKVKLKPHLGYKLNEREIYIKEGRKLMNVYSHECGCIC